jgi:hypothetical protein
MSNLNWSRPTSLAFRWTTQARFWNSSHDAAVLPAAGGVSAVVAADTGGVWSVTDGGAATSHAWNTALTEKSHLCRRRYRHWSCVIQLRDALATSASTDL